MRVYLVFLAVLALLVTPRPAPAQSQRDALLQSFAALYATLAGDHGDEGSHAIATLDRLEADLTRWVESQRATETQLLARPAAAMDLALLYADERRFDAAHGVVAAAIAAEPARADLHLLRGLLLDAMERHADAASAFAAASEAEPLNLAAAYLAASRPVDGTLADEVQARFLRATEQAPNRRPRFPEFGLLRDSSSTVPAFAPAAYADAFTLLSQNRFRDAISAFRAALARDPLMTDPAARDARVLAWLTARRQHRPAPLEQLVAAVESLPDSAEAHRILGLAYRAASNLPQSVTELERAVQLAPRDERARVALGMTLAESRRLDDAERVLRETIDLLPASGAARWMLSFVYEAQGRRQDASAVLADATSLTFIAGKAAVYGRMGVLANRQQDFDALVVVFGKRARLLPNDGDAHKNLGLAYAGVGRESEALVELLLARVFGIEDAHTLTMIGQMHLNAGQLDAAERALRAALEREPQRGQTLYALGTTLVRAGKTAEGQQHLDTFKRLRTAVRDNQQRRFAEESSTAGGSTR